MSSKVYAYEYRFLYDPATTGYSDIRDWLEENAGYPGWKLDALNEGQAEASVHPAAGVCQLSLESADGNGPFWDDSGIDLPALAEFIGTFASSGTSFKLVDEYSCRFSFAALGPEGLTVEEAIGVDEVFHLVEAAARQPSPLQAAKAARRKAETKTRETEHRIAL